MIVRSAARGDLGQMTDLLNDIIEVGGTTAMIEPVSVSDLQAKMDFDPDRSAWTVAEDAQILGFQWISPHPDLPPAACDIASFVKIGITGRGVGTAMFERTQKQALLLGYSWINANIRADNLPGLTYYSAKGFYDWNLKTGSTLANGVVVDKVFKRFDLQAMS